ncbi:1-phosphofructokinase family hexose kinase [Halomonas litopenaei]|uniref:1-phosphofructokinase family hexose kinase n=1 Tax=Halomonas litopenaei TaxID=2109328 RepID=UPI001A8E1A5C|nr:1-phosphofructokinase family hexose kinase [Halomonas litopenaei]MBN8411548.1 1-phosphofructokinase family hexose kinase [Halomonas litopenaei]
MSRNQDEANKAPVLTISANPALDLSVGLAQLVPGALHRAESVELTAAGKGVNMARVLAALGHPVCVTGFLGKDNDAAFVDAFADMGVEDAFVRLPGATRINTKLTEQDGRVSDINAPGLALEEEHWQRLLDTLDQRLSQPQLRPAAVMIGGSLPPGIAPQALGELISRVKAAGIPVWADTSGEALRVAVKAGADAVKPNVEELADWAGRALPGDDAIHQATLELFAAGVGDVVVSAGASGVTWLGQQGLWQSLPPAVKVSNTVCAGDTLFAGLLHGVLCEWSAEQALRFATALSAEAVRHTGVGCSDAGDFSDLLSDTRVRRRNDVEARGVMA